MSEKYVKLIFHLLRRSFDSFSQNSSINQGLNND
eukprot:UN17301